MFEVMAIDKNSYEWSLRDKDGQKMTSIYYAPSFVVRKTSNKYGVISGSNEYGIHNTSGMLSDEEISMQLTLSN